ncbi:STAS domain-containing protein [Rhodocaloribacter litoris]|uniref:STAS domain-containing protein n=1 Tax=Rhodocaloribacter litoris TaxID=2558931 RepID=UPI0014216DC0|nr:STAS domain-containing protein [Rhodocaloribacter litoris]QXD16693.1 STAS domain-containing protein [Rhodocaloribacter litoris]GIV59309.1 MAG: anti-sigma factor antagonist [Rhodothermaceae bacterium]
MSNFSVGFRTNGSIQVLDLKGELDAHTASELEAAIQKCRRENRCKIVVNGENLKYISSAGLGVFMAYIEELREQGGDIKIAALQPKVYNVFDLLGFPMLFDIVQTEEEAVARFQQNGEQPDEPA